MGAATDNDNVYVALTPIGFNLKSAPPEKAGGIFAYELATANVAGLCHW